MEQFLQFLGNIHPVVYLMIVIIIVTFGCNLYKLHKEIKPIKSDLDEALNFLNKYNNIISPDQYEEIKDKFSKLSCLHKQWLEFTETVLPITTIKEIIEIKEEIEIKKKIEIKEIYNTQQAELFLNNETIINSNVNVSWYKSVPGVLTGLGLLGTFIALLIGLYHINVTPDGNVEGISGLINGLSGKFCSSIIGLAASMCFLWLESKVVGGIKTNCLKLQHKLNTIFARNFSENILLKVSKSMDEQAVALQNFNSDLAGRLKESLNESMGPTMDRMATATEKLLKVIEDSEENKKDSITGAIKEMSQILQQQSENMSKNFTDSLTGAANSEIQKLSGSLANAANFLQGMDEKNNSLNEKMGSMLSNLDINIRLQQEQSQAQNKAVTELTENLLSQMGSSSSQHFENLQSTVNNVIFKLSEMTQTMNDQLTNNNDRLLQKGIEQQDKLQGTLDFMLQKVESNLGAQQEFSVRQQEQYQIQNKAVTELTENILNQMGSSSSQHFENLQSTVNNVIFKLSEMSKTMNDQLTNNNEQLIQKGIEQQEQYQAQNRTVNELTENILNQMGNSSSKHFESLQSTVNDVIFKLSETSQTMNDQLTNNNERLLQKGIEQQDKIQGTLDFMLQKVESNMGTQHELSVRQQEKLAESMDNLVKTLEAGSVSYVQKIEETFNNMLSKTSGWTEKVNEQLLNTMQTQSEQNENIQQTVSLIQDNLNSFREVIQANQNLISKIENVSNDLVKSSMTLEASSNSNSESQAHVVESINQIIGEMNKYRDNIESTKAIWERQKQFCETFDNGLGELLTKLNTKMIEYSNNTSKSLGTYLDQFDKCLGGAVSQISGAVSELSVNLEELGDTIEDSIKKARIGV